MKTEEDEAFDDLAKKQGSWGGGYQAKRQMAADKFIAAEERKVGERYGYVPKLHPSEWIGEPAQPQQDESDLLTIAYQSGFYDGKKAALAQPAQEPVECLDCGSHNVGIAATYDSLINSVKALNT